MLEAMNVARDRKSSVVTQLVSSGAANARDIAVAASNEFGVPLIDLDSVSLDLEVVRLVSEKLVAKHRVLPIFRRGKRLFLMSPLHHHFESLGWDETKVVVRFWILGLIMALFALTTLKLR